MNYAVLSIIAYFNIALFVNIKSYIDELLADFKAEIKSRLPDILNIIEANCQANISDYMAIDEGVVALKDWSAIPKETLSAISEVQIIREFKDANGKTGDIVKFKLNDKKPYIDLLMKYLEVINEKVEITGKDGGAIEQKIIIEVVTPPNYEDE
jgi:hypothetical protein